MPEQRRTRATEVFLPSISLGDGIRVAYPVATRPAVRHAMQGNRGVDTKPEKLLRSELHRRGLRFRKSVQIVTPERRVRADIVFPRQQLAIFVDGCFWHCCSLHGNTPHSNANYWQAKLARNRNRDAAVNEALAQAGWFIARVWEHEDPAEAALAIERLVRDRA